jgi:hypothetical protein
MSTMTLAEYAKGSRNTLVTGVIETFAQASPFLRRLTFRNVEGGALQYQQEKTLPGIAFRAINGSYTADSGLILPLVEKTKPLGGEADTDTILVQRFGMSRRATDIAMKIKAAAKYFDKILIDGDETTDPLIPNGLNVRLTGDQLVHADGAGTIGYVLTENAIDRLVDACDEKPDMLVMGKAVYRQLKNLFKGSVLFGFMDAAYFGFRVPTFDGIEIAIVDKDNDGNVILGMDETDGSSSGTTGSIYAIKFGVDQYISGIQSAPPKFTDFGEISSSPVYRFRWEWDCGFAMFHPKCAARLKGVLAAAGVS